MAARRAALSALQRLYSTARSPSGPLSVGTASPWSSGRTGALSWAGLTSQTCGQHAALGRAFGGAVRGFAATAAPAAPRPSSTAWRYISLLGSRPCSLSLLSASSSVCTPDSPECVLGLVSGRRASKCLPPAYVTVVAIPADLRQKKFALCKGCALVTYLHYSNTKQEY